MDIRFLEHHEDLTRFFSDFEHAEFLQSWEWGVFQESLNRKIFRFGIWDEGSLRAVVLCVRHQLPFGKVYWYCPRGPIFSPKFSVEKRERAFVQLIDFIREHLGNQDAFLRLEPTCAFPSEISFRNTPWVQPTLTLLLDLTKSEEDLFQEIKQKTRYNIRIADKRGVKIYEDHSTVGFEKFYGTMTMMSRRQGIRLHPRTYYEHFVEQLSRFDMIRLYIAEHEGDVLASALCVGFGDTFVYAHGGSTDVKRAFKAPERLQWFAIQEAKKAGFRFYDFFGIAPEDEKGHKLVGVSKFKRGFGGFEYAYPYRGDIVWDSFSYNVLRLSRTVRRFFHFF